MRPDFNTPPERLFQAAGPGRAPAPAFRFSHGRKPSIGFGILEKKTRPCQNPPQTRVDLRIFAAIVELTPRPPGAPENREKRGFGSHIRFVKREGDTMPPYRIILADDHAMLREGIANLINAAKGLQIVGEASDGLMLLKLLNHTTPDMVIMDVSMPGLRGIEAAQEIRKTHPGVAVLFLSMHKKKEYLHLALATGAKGYVLKEDSGSELIQAIAAIRKGKTYLSPLFMQDVPADLIPTGPGSDHPPYEPLTAREKQVLQLIAEGKTSKEIGALLFISVHTVHSHRKNIKNKLDVRKNADLIRYAMEKGYTDQW